MELDENDIAECSNLRRERFAFPPEGPRTPSHLWGTENPAAREFGTRFGWAFNMPRPVDRIGQWDTSGWEEVKVSDHDDNFADNISTADSVVVDVSGGITRLMNWQPSSPQENKRPKLQLHNKSNYDENSVESSRYADFQSQRNLLQKDDGATVVTTSTGGSSSSGRSNPQSGFVTSRGTTSMVVTQTHNSQQADSSNATLVTNSTAATQPSAMHAPVPSSPDAVPKAMLYAAYGKDRT